MTIVSVEGPVSNVGISSFAAWCAIPAQCVNIDLSLITWIEEACPLQILAKYYYNSGSLLATIKH